MPKVKKTESEERIQEVRCALNDVFFRSFNNSNDKLGKVIGASDRTALNRRKNPQTLTLEEIWAIEKAAGRQLTMPFQHKG